MKIPASIDRLRRFIATAHCLAIAVGSVACALPVAGAEPWERRLSGPALVLLGEVHDNADGQRLRLAALRRAIARGWRPVIVMEQFDTDRQALLDEARRERPRDAGHLIDKAGRPGWDWPLYRPLIQLALDHDLTLLAANLPRSVASRLVREDGELVLGAERAGQLGLDQTLPAALLTSQQRAIDLGHCGALPASVLPGMVRAQSARDAVIAELLARHRGTGAVLIAGNGHVRRDIGVPYWLQTRHDVPPDEVVAVGYVESPDDAAPTAFDAVIAIPPKSDRIDPCLQFRRDRSGSPR